MAHAHSVRGSHWRLASWCAAAAIAILSTARLAAAQALPPVAIAERTVSVHGIDLHYQEAGAGPMVVLLHGLAGSSVEWRPTLQALAGRYRVIALDQVGFGRSGKPLIANRRATFVDFLGGFLDALAIDHAAVVGNSQGGWVAARPAIARPGLVDRPVLVNAAGVASFANKAGPETVNALRLSTRADLQRVSELTFHNPAFASDAAVDGAFAGRIAAGGGHAIDRLIDSMLRAEDALDHDLPRITPPTLIVWGASDRLVPASFASRFVRGIHGARLETIDACGHMPPIECSSAFAASLLDLLGGRSP